MPSAMNAHPQPTLCQIFLQTSQNSPNCVKQVCIPQCYHRHGNVNSRKGWFLCEITVTFLQISRKPQLRSRRPRKSMNRCFQRHIVCMEKLSIVHTRVEYKNTLKNAMHTNGRKKNPIPPLPQSNTPIPWPTPLTTPNGIQMQSAVLQYTLWTDRLTGRLGDRTVRIPTYNLYIDWEWCG